MQFRRLHLALACSFLLALTFTPAVAEESNLRGLAASDEKKDTKDSKPKANGGAPASNASDEDIYQQCRTCFDDTLVKFCYDDNSCVGLVDSCDSFALTKSACQNRKKCLECKQKTDHYWCVSSKKCISDSKNCIFEAIMPEDC